MIFEIVKEDSGTSVFELSDSLEKLERDFLKNYRLINYKDRIIVYEVNDEFNRIDKLKEYDKYTNKELQTFVNGMKSENALKKLSDILFVDLFGGKDNDGSSKEDEFKFE